jgi:hypothetical protein
MIAALFVKFRYCCHFLSSQDWLVLPVCAIVSIVYKAIRTQSSAACVKSW